MRVNEIARDDQQIVQRQQDQAAQLDHDGLLRGGERRAQGVWTKGEILGRFTALPLAHRGHADVVALGQFRQGSRTGFDLGSCARSRACLGGFRSCRAVLSKWFDDAQHQVSGFEQRPTAGGYMITRDLTGIHHLG